TRVGSAISPSSGGRAPPRNRGGTTLGASALARPSSTAADSGAREVWPSACEEPRLWTTSRGATRRASRSFMWLLGVSPYGTGLLAEGWSAGQLRYHGRGRRTISMRLGSLLVRYLRGLTPPRVVLWCYFIWW